MRSKSEDGFFFKEGDRLCNKNERVVDWEVKRQLKPIGTLTLQS
jgi:hypothetical protein